MEDASGAFFTAADLERYSLLPASLRRVGRNPLRHFLRQLDDQAQERAAPSNSNGEGRQHSQGTAAGPSSRAHEGSPGTAPHNAKTAPQGRPVPQKPPSSWRIPKPVSPADLGSLDASHQATQSTSSSQLPGIHPIPSSQPAHSASTSQPAVTHASPTDPAQLLDSPSTSQAPAAHLLPANPVLPSVPTQADPQGLPCAHLGSCKYNEQPVTSEEAPEGAARVPQPMAVPLVYSPGKPSNAPSRVPQPTAVPLTYSPGKTTELPSRIPQPVAVPPPCSPGKPSESPTTFDTPPTAASWMTSQSVATVNAPTTGQAFHTQPAGPLRAAVRIVPTATTFAKPPILTAEAQAAWLSLSREGPQPLGEKSILVAAEDAGKQDGSRVDPEALHGVGPEATLATLGCTADSGAADNSTAVPFGGPVGTTGDDFMDILSGAVEAGSPVIEDAEQLPCLNLDAWVEDLCQEVMSHGTDSHVDTDVATSQGEPSTAAGTACQLATQLPTAQPKQATGTKIASCPHDEAAEKLVAVCGTAADADVVDIQHGGHGRQAGHALGTPCRTSSAENTPLAANRSFRLDTATETAAFAAQAGPHSGGHGHVMHPASAQPPPGRAVASYEPAKARPADHMHLPKVLAGCEARVESCPLPLGKHHQHHQHHQQHHRSDITASLESSAVSCRETQSVEMDDAAEFSAPSQLQEHRTTRGVSNAGDVDMDNAAGFPARPQEQEQRTISGVSNEGDMDMDNAAGFPARRSQEQRTTRGVSNAGDVDMDNAAGFPARPQSQEQRTTGGISNAEAVEMGDAAGLPAPAHVPAKRHPGKVQDAEDVLDGLTVVAAAHEVQDHQADIPEPPSPSQLPLPILLSPGSILGKRTGPAVECLPRLDVLQGTPDGSAGMDVAPEAGMTSERHDLQGPDSQPAAVTVTAGAAGGLPAGKRMKLHVCVNESRPFAEHMLASVHTIRAEAVTAGDTPAACRIPDEPNVSTMLGAAARMDVDFVQAEHGRQAGETGINSTAGAAHVDDSSVERKRGREGDATASTHTTARASQKLPDQVSQHAQPAPGPLVGKPPEHRANPQHRNACSGTTHSACTRSPAAAPQCNQAAAAASPPRPALESGWRQRPQIPDGKPLQSTSRQQVTSGGNQHETSTQARHDDVRHRQQVDTSTQPKAIPNNQHARSTATTRGHSDGGQQGPQCPGKPLEVHPKGSPNNQHDTTATGRQGDTVSQRTQVPGSTLLTSTSHQHKTSPNDWRGSSSTAAGREGGGHGVVEALGATDLAGSRDMDGVAPLESPPVSDQEGNAASAHGARNQRQNAPSIVDLCNPKSKWYDPDFAAKYHNARAAADSRYAGKKARRKTHRWSALTAEEHHWFSTHSGMRLSGAEAIRYSELSSRVNTDQQHYLYAIYQDVLEVDPQRYKFTNAVLQKQLEADTAYRKQRMLSLPQLYRLYRKFPVSVDCSPAKSTDPALVHMKLLHQEGVCREWKDPPARVKFPYGVPFLPATISATAGAAKAPAAAAGWRPVRKQALPPLAEDPVLREQVGTSSPHFVMTSSAFIRLAGLVTPNQPDGWELPVTVEAVDAAGQQEDQPVSQRTRRRAAETTAPKKKEPSGKSATRVIIDKPLLKRNPTYREQYQRLYKYALLTVGVSQSPDHELPHTLHTHTATPASASPTAPPRAAVPAPEGATVSATGHAADGPSGTKRGSATGETMSLDRLVCYDLWGLGGYRVLLRRSRVAKRRAGGEDGGGGVPVGLVVRCRTEYLGGVCAEYEEVTAQEMLSWWAGLVIRPGSHMVVGHVVPHTSKLMGVDDITLPDIHRMAAETFTEAAALRTVHSVLGQLSMLPPGQYLLTHAPGENVLTCFRALPLDVHDTERPSQPLPISSRSASPSHVYNLHAAHKHSGSMDTEAPLFIPPRWAPKDPYLHQIPHTFPPRPIGADGASRQGGRGRRRKMLPSAWNELGVLGDWDKVEVSEKPGKGDYARQLAEDLS